MASKDVICYVFAFKMNVYTLREISPQICWGFFYVSGRPQSSGNSVRHVIKYIQNEDAELCN